MREIPLTNSTKVALVDDEDYDRLIGYSWRLERSGGLEYAAKGRSSAKMQNEIMRPALEAAVPKTRIDHRNLNGLDNRKSNLRLCTNQQNCANRGKQSNNTSGYKGVYLLAKGKAKPWHARVGSRKENGILHGGYFATAEEAARKYDELAVELYGEFARLNFPTQEI
jgi:hypothetical protein